MENILPEVREFIENQIEAEYYEQYIKDPKVYHAPLKEFISVIKGDRGHRKHYYCDLYLKGTPEVKITAFLHRHYRKNEVDFNFSEELDRTRTEYSLLIPLIYYLGEEGFKSGECSVIEELCYNKEDAGK